MLDGEWVVLVNKLYNEWMGVQVVLPTQLKDKQLNYWNLNPFGTRRQVGGCVDGGSVHEYFGGWLGLVGE